MDLLWTDRTELRLSESIDARVADTTTGENDVRAWSNTLAHKWVEVELLLRRPITCDEDIMYTMAASEAGLLFMDQLDKTAKSLNCLRGAISRWILPYDASTSVADQSSMIRQVLDSTPDDLQGRLSEKHISYLVAGANSVRKLVRVKVRHTSELPLLTKGLANLSIPNDRSRTTTTWSRRGSPSPRPMPPEPPTATRKPSPRPRIAPAPRPMRPARRPRRPGNVTASGADRQRCG